MKPRPRRQSHPVEVPTSHLEALLDASSDAVFTCRNDGTVISANAQAERLTGFNRRDMIGKKLGKDFLLLPKGLLEAWRGSYDQADARRDPSGLTITIQDRAGRSHTCRARYFSFDETSPEKPCGFSIHLLDTTELADLQGALMTIEEHHRTLVEGSSDVIFQMRPNLLIQSVNPAVRTVIGYDPAELVGQRLDLPLFLPPEEVRRLRVIGASAILRDGVRNKLFRIYRKTGALFWGLLTLAPIRQSRFSPSILGILRDVSEFYETREQLEYQHAQLKRTVSQLEESYRLQEQFVANVTHELRTPLTTILITSEMLGKHAREDLRPAQRRHVDLILKNSKVLLEIINDLLDLAKLKRDGFRLMHQEVCLCDFLQELAEEVEPLFAQKNLTLTVEMDSHAPEFFRTDPTVLRKIVMNILSNASKFTQEGGAVMKVGSETGWLCLGVSDSGIGIDPSEIPHLFEEFRQVDGSDSRRYPGTGLGLTISERFTQLLGGHIQVESKPGVGSTFTIHLPIQGDKATTPNTV